MGESPVAERFYNCGHLPWLVQIYAGFAQNASKVSVTFDPFCYLTLPLPMKKDRTMEVFLVRTDPQFRPMQVRTVSWKHSGTCFSSGGGLKDTFVIFQYRVVVPKMGVVADLCSALTKLSGVPSENVRLCGSQPKTFFHYYVVLRDGTFKSKKIVVIYPPPYCSKPIWLPWNKACKFDICVLLHTESHMSLKQMRLL